MSSIIPNTAIASNGGSRIEPGEIVAVGDGESEVSASLAERLVADRLADAVPDKSTPGKVRAAPTEASGGTAEATGGIPA